MPESLTKAQEQQLRALFDAIMQDNVVLRRSFGGDIPNSYVLTKRVNRVIEERPELQRTAVAMILYPALKWMLQAKSLDTLIQECESITKDEMEDEEAVKRLQCIQEWLAPSIDNESLHFRKRARYFKACERLVTAIEDVYEEIQSEYNANSNAADVFNCFLNPSTLPMNGRSKIIKHCEYCIEFAYRSIGSVVDKYYEAVMQTDDIDGIEEACLYHNVPLLLSEYTRILYRASKSHDPAMKILSSSSYEELRKYKPSDRAMNDAYLIVEYVKLIRGAIELMKTFPLGERYHDIILAMVEGRKNNRTDDQIAQSLDITPGTFSIRKGHAIGVFGCLLWGCDANGLLNCLVDVRV